MYGRPPTGSLANRPSSRAGGGKVPPSTGASGVPRTAMMPPGTASRNPPRTGMNGPRINVVDRPTTQQGLGGMRLKTSGPGRQVQDTTFFQTELRRKLNMIVDETHRLQQEIENTTKENANYAAFEKKADGLAAELRELQGQLGDYNTVVDKLNTGTDLEEFEKQYSLIKGKNAKTSRSLDEMFTKRKEKETEIKGIEVKIEEEKAKSEKLILNLDAEKQEQFQKLKKENQEYLLQITSMHEEINQMNKEYGHLQDQVGHDSLKQKAITVYQRLTQVKEKRAELELSLEKSQLESGPQERARLLEQVKSDNLETSGMERKISEIQSQIKTLQEQIAQAGGELDAAEAEKQAKFEELIKKDAEMQEFLDSFDAKRDEIKNQTQASERLIVDLLQKIETLSLKTTSALPTKKEFSDLNTDLSVKKTDLKNADATIEALILEKQARQEDFEKVGQLEIKLKNEVTNLTEKTANLKKKLDSIEDLDAAKSKAEADIKNKKDLIIQLKAKQDVVNNQVLELNTVYDAKRAQLQENDTFNQLSSLETKLKSAESVVYGMKDYIASKTAESNYKPLAGHVLKMIDEVNSQLIKISQMAPAR